MFLRGFLGALGVFLGGIYLSEAKRGARRFEQKFPILRPGGDARARANEFRAEILLRDPKAQETYAERERSAKCGALRAKCGMRSESKARSAERDAKRSAECGA